jgi:hypothetical protein
MRAHSSVINIASSFCVQYFEVLSEARRTVLIIGIKENFIIKKFSFMDIACEYNYTHSASIQTGSDCSSLRGRISLISRLCK